MRRSAAEMEAKGDRALELFEKRLPMFVISERLGISAQHLGPMIDAARKRRNEAQEQKD